MSHSLIQASNTTISPSSIVAILSTPRTSGPSPSPASCTLALRVRILVLHKLAAVLKANITNIVMGTMVVYQSMQPLSSESATIPYFSIVLSLNILLTLMIVIRLILHTRNIQTAMGTAGKGGLCKAIVTMFIESYAINTVTSLLALVLFSAENDTTVIFINILPMIPQGSATFSPWYIGDAT